MASPLALQTSVNTSGTVPELISPPPAAQVSPSHDAAREARPISLGSNKLATAEKLQAAIDAIDDLVARWSPSSFRGMTRGERTWRMTAAIAQRIGGDFPKEAKALKAESSQAFEYFLTPKRGLAYFGYLMEEAGDWFGQPSERAQHAAQKIDQAISTLRSGFEQRLSELASPSSPRIKTWNALRRLEGEARFAEVRFSGKDTIDALQIALGKGASILASDYPAEAERLSDAVARASNLSIAVARSDLLRTLKEVGADVRAQMSAG